MKNIVKKKTEKGNPITISQVKRFFRSILLVHIFRNPSDPQSTYFVDFFKTNLQKFRTMKRTYVNQKNQAKNV